MTKAEFIQRAAIAMAGNPSISRDYPLHCGIIIIEAEKLADQIESFAEFKD